MRTPKQRHQISTLSERKNVQIKSNSIKIKCMLPMLESQTEALNFYCLLAEKKKIRHGRNSKI